ncbi:hypothetical protein AM609_11410 [Actinomyces sp. oral taxon 414]|uniref:C40 family peptidase n=1 Tax=Actinomyces sp. oral taxon 414 TaxID=712122 RepID=UPI0006B042F6|nr:C40 family peptidase [Actinomyces sp. oral taxon 414]ALC99917.1 hypothetical protein AM609_11410 [Actinomyces sp. oral taxon 414]
MTSRNLARHRKAARPLTPLSDAAPALRRGFAVAASSGLALTMIASAANAAGGSTQSLEHSAGTLSIGPTARAAALAAQNAPIEVGADVIADADTLAVSEVTVEAPGPSEEELAAQAAAEAQAQAEQAAAEAEQAAAQAAAEAQAQAEQAAAQAQAQAEQAAAQAEAEQAQEAPVQAAPAVSTEDDTAEATAVSAPAAVPQGVGSGAVAIGSNYLGTPYVWGGGGPGGFDCSGFVSYVYAQMGISLPHQSGDILNSGTVISASEARPGDILWWPGHVGIYAGDGQVLHSTPGPGVSITNIWGSPTYLRVG